MVKTYRPTSSGKRQKISLVYDTLTKGKKPEKGLLVWQKSDAGRSRGRVTVRHQGGGVKRMYRLIDFKRDKRGVPGRVAAIEYDPNRGPNIALLHYLDGEKRYILAPEGLLVGMEVLASGDAEIQVGNALPLSKIPLGVFIHNVELQPGRGGQVARGAGNFTEILAKEGNFAQIKMPSGEVRKVPLSCCATIGVLGNADLKNEVLGKAGVHRYLGVRPAVRGVAMNPRDHAHGGGEGRSGIGMKAPKSYTGKRFMGIKTRRRKHTNTFIISRRK